LVGLGHQKLDIVADDLRRGVAKYSFRGAVEGLHLAEAVGNDDGVDRGVDDREIAI
jgi:hypothetical protein